MVLIRTLLRARDGTFRPIEEVARLESGPDDIEGALELSVNGVELLGEAEWDYVDQLWCYLADMVTTFRRTGQARTYLPDQPVEVSFRRDRDRVVVAVEYGDVRRRTSAPVGEFLDALRVEGDRALELLAALAPRNENAYLAARNSLRA